ncbi:MAG: hypothetical protein C0513_09150 [Isosphaera sp.]|nr:hypothetical protein [Isosphaera sp.]
MHITTKILIVLGALLSVALSSLTIAYTANADTLRQQIDAERQAKDTANADLSLERTRSQTDLADARQRAENAESARDQLQSQINDLMQERARLINEAALAKLEAERIGNQIQSLGSTAETQQTLLSSLNEENSALRKRLTDGAQREVQLIDRQNELEGQRQVLQQNVRALTEQLNEARLAIQNARSGGNAQGNARPIEALFGPRVDTRVRSIARAPNGDELVTIAAGSASGLRENIKLTVFRDGEGFLANLILTRVDITESVGRLDKLGRDVTIREGDLVTSRIE